MKVKQRNTYETLGRISAEKRLTRFAGDSVEVVANGPVAANATDLVRRGGGAGTAHGSAHAHATGHPVAVNHVT